MAINLAKEGAKREELLKAQFASARRRATGQQRETERQSRKGFQRLAATTGKTGGAIQKAQQTAIKDIGTAFADVESGIAGQEAAAIEQVRGQTQQQRLARDEARAERELRSDQFKEQLAFQKDSFAQQMAFQFAEFDENRRTNFINSLNALKDSGFGPKDLKKMQFLIDDLFPQGASGVGKAATGGSSGKFGNLVSF